MKTFVSFLLGGVVSAGVLGVLWLDVPLPVLATVLAGAACLAWLGVLVVLPWNLTFEARRVLFEFGRARARGIAVDAQQEARARQVARRMLRVSIGLHLVSAALLALGSWAAQVPWGHAFAGLFGLSTFFRPAVEYYRYLRRQLADLLDESRFPRVDVVKLRADLEALQCALDAREAAHEALRRRLETTEAQLEVRLADANRRFEGVARRFDEALDHLTDNREVIAGLRAFLRLVRETAPSRG